MEPTSARGTRIANRFELLAPLADVGVGEGWSARDAQGGEVRVSLLGNVSPTQTETLGALVGTLRTLSNPSIVATLDAGVEGGRAWAASEPCEGRSLAHWIEGHRQAGTHPGFGVVQRIFDRIASSLQAAHAAGVVHGALSPRCVVIKRLGTGQHHVRLVDFALGPFTLSAHTTPSWMDYQAPEQRGPRGDDGPAVDVFAAAVLLTEMLTLSAGPRPDTRETWAAFAREARASGVVERLASLRATVPRGVWEIVAATLAGSAKERAAGVLRLQRAVREAWSSAGEWDRSGSAEPDPPAPDPSHPRLAQVTAPQRVQRHSGIEGWQSAERAQAPAPAPRASAVIEAPVAPSWPSAPVVPARPSLPEALSPVDAEPAVDDATEAIDLDAAARYLQELHGAATAGPPRSVTRGFAPTEHDPKERTRALDGEVLRAVQAELGALDDGDSTAVRSQGFDIAAAVAAADTARRTTDESTRVFDVASPESGSGPRPSAAAWSPPNVGEGTTGDPFSAATGFGVDDPFGGSEASIPPMRPSEPGAWSAAAPAPSPFVATLKAVPREAVARIPRTVAAPAAPKVWGAAPTASAQTPRSSRAPSAPPWRWALLGAVVLGIATAILVVLRAR